MLTFFVAIVIKFCFHRSIDLEDMTKTLILVKLAGVAWKSIPPKSIPPNTSYLRRGILFLRSADSSAQYILNFIGSGEISNDHGPKCVFYYDIL